MTNSGCIGEEPCCGEISRRERLGLREDSICSMASVPRWGGLGTLCWWGGLGALCWCLLCWWSSPCWLNSSKYWVSSLTLQHATLSVIRLQHATPNSIRLPAMLATKDTNLANPTKLAIPRFSKSSHYEIRAANRDIFSPELLGSQENSFMGIVCGETVNFLVVYYYYAGGPSLHSVSTVKTRDETRDKDQARSGIKATKQKS